MSIRNELLEEILSGIKSVSGETFQFEVGGSTIIPVSDLTIYTVLMSTVFDSADYGIRFYSDSSALVPVTPSAGIIDFSSSSDIPDAAGNGADTDFRYRDVIEGSSMASEVDDPSAPLISSLGMTTKTRLILSGVTGASHFRAWVRRK